MLKSPSKHIGLERLKAIRIDNYCGLRSEYVSEELDALIDFKSQKKADGLLRDWVANIEPRKETAWDVYQDALQVYDSLHSQDSYIDAVCAGMLVNSLTDNFCLEVL